MENSGERPSQYCTDREEVFYTLLYNVPYTTIVTESNKYMRIEKPLNTNTLSLSHAIILLHSPQYGIWGYKRKCEK